MTGDVCHGSSDRDRVLTGVVLVALAAPAWAQAELTVESVPAGTTQQLHMEVPGEREGDATNQVEIQLPSELTEAMCGQKAGWSCTEDTSGPSRS